MDGTCEDGVDLLDEVSTGLAAQIAGLGGVLGLLVVVEGGVVAVTEGVHF